MLWLIPVGRRRALGSSPPIVSMPPLSAPLPPRWVLVETAPWGHRMRLPGHHLARWLVARGCTVAYVSAPVSPWHFVSARAREDARRRWSQEGALGQWRSPRLFTFIPRTWLPVAAARPFDNNACWNGSEWASRPRAGQVLREAGFARADVMVVQNFQMPHLVRHVDARVLVVRLEDDISAFPAMPRVIVRRHREIIADADLVTITAQGLRPHAERAGAREVMHLPNGVDAARFERPASFERPADLPPSPVATYVGALDAWFDEELLADVATRLPQWSFALIGPPRRPFERLRALPNVHFLGPRPQEQVPPCLWSSDAGIIPFRRTQLIETVSPLKLFEDLAAGLPVVSTRWSEMERLGSPAKLASTAAEFAGALEGARAPKGGVGYAREFDWDAVFGPFAARVGELAR